MWSHEISAVPGDANGDGVVDILDLLVVIDQWGVCPDEPAECPGDVTGDRVTDVQDLLMVIEHWGR